MVTLAVLLVSVLTMLLTLGALAGLVWLAVPSLAAQFTNMLQGLPTDAAQLEALLEDRLDHSPQLAALLF